MRHPPPPMPLLNDDTYLRPILVVWKNEKKYIYIYIYVINDTYYIILYYLNLISPK